MKNKLIMFAIMTIFMVGCGDETTIEGYTDEDVQNMFAVFKDSVVQGIEDSIMQSAKDTVYKISKDTIYKNTKDTIYLATKDTVYSIKTNDSIVYVYKTDTIHNVVDDTILIRLADSVYRYMESLPDEIPRDTSITLIDTINSESGFTVISKTWKGITYKGIFYDTSAYLEHRGTSYNTSEMQCVDRCGRVNDPDVGSSCWRSAEKMKPVFDGWRRFNFEDVVILKNMLSNVIGSNKINIAYLPTILAISPSGELESISGKSYYMCAYDLSHK